MDADLAQEVTRTTSKPTLDWLVMFVLSFDKEGFRK